MIPASFAGPDRGFALIDLMMTVAVMSILFAIAVPSVARTIDFWRLGAATREVERELQTARLKAVATNHRMQLRLNCPATGQYRMVEVTGVAGTDNSGARCDQSAFPYPGPRDTDTATPALDGPVRALYTSVTMTGPDLQFAPDGTVAKLVSGTPTAIVGNETITVTYKTDTHGITVNSLGRMAIQ